MKNKLNKLFPLAILLFLSLGCSFVNQVKKQVEESQQPKVIKSTDNKCQLTIPGNWKIETGLNDQASLQAANKFSEQYAVVISETKEDFGDNFTLDDFSKIILENTRTTIQNAVISDVKTISVNGYPAKQFEVEGEMDKIKAKWLFTLIDAPKNYHQILNWTLSSKYEKNKPVFLEVINSFTETEGNLAPPPPPPPAKSTK